MNSYYQETESRIIFSARGEMKYAEKIGNETFGRKPEWYFYSLSENRLIKSALEILRARSDQDISKRAKTILLLIQETVFSIQHLNFDLAYLPPLSAMYIEDGSILIEWAFKDFRIGFTIETIPEESGWYLVSNRQLGGILASGNISNIDLKIHLLWLLNFVFSHS